MTDTSWVERAVDRWVGAAVISAEQGRAIVDHERADPTPVGQSMYGAGTAPRSADEAAGAATATAAASPGRGPARGGGGRAAEAIGYLGAALAVGALALILDELWRELVPGARLALASLVTVILAGSAFGLRRASGAAMDRLVSVLSTLAVAGTAWTASVLLRDVVDVATSPALVLVGLAATAAAAVSYLPRPRLLPQVALLLASLFTVLQGLDLPDLRPGSLWYGVVTAAVGGVWLVLGRGGWLTPRRTAELTGGALVLIGVQGASFSDARTVVLAIGIGVAGALVALAIRTDVLHMLAVGALGAFVLVPQLVFEVFGDRIGAPATLLLVGLLLVLLAVGTGRAHQEVAR
ncbi:MAG: hypothetical protein JJT89_14380 [Nitriliruptoraceae bacterium]|nr:hypothetical protein [Nitriliruptoraceae bacterium]